ncbi:MAG: hypothetical protein K2O63_01130 [Alistipes sp.]|nr:hypothetical protein [Alistipes sp.]
MKKLFVLLVGMLLCGCEQEMVDYAGFSRFVWCNEGSRPVVLSVEDARGDFLLRETTLAPGRSIETEEIEGGMAHCPAPSECIWAVAVAYEDGTSARYVRLQASGPVPCDPSLECNYTPDFQDRAPMRCRWVYTFTDDDYRAAAERGEDAE